MYRYEVLIDVFYAAEQVRVSVHASGGEAVLEALDQAFGEGGYRLCSFMRYEATPTLEGAS